jgi:hypothetical protein
MRLRAASSPRHAVFDFQNFFDKESAHGIGHAQAGQLRAGVVQRTMRPAVSSTATRPGNRVQRRGYKAAFDGQGALGTLAGALCLLLRKRIRE